MRSHGIKYLNRAVYARVRIYESWEKREGNSVQLLANQVQDILDDILDEAACQQS